QVFVQFGNAIRTWWPLTYTEPGTTFTLWLTVRCQRIAFPNDVDLHVERWRWLVVVTFESLQAVIDLLHENPIGTSEIPCIAAENMYSALKQSVRGWETGVSAAPASFVNRRNDVTQDNGGAAPSQMQANINRVTIQNDVFNLEALITV